MELIWYQISPPPSSSAPCEVGSCTRSLICHNASSKSPFSFLPTSTHTPTLSYIFLSLSYYPLRLFLQSLALWLLQHRTFLCCSTIIQTMVFTPENQILVGVAVAVVAIGVGAIYLYSSKKPKGFFFLGGHYLVLPIWKFYASAFDLCLKGRNNRWIIIFWVFSILGILCLGSVDSLLWGSGVNKDVFFFFFPFIFLWMMFWFSILFFLIACYRCPFNLFTFN